MPLVLVHVKNESVLEKLTTETLTYLTNILLPQETASALSIENYEETSITPEDVDVWLIPNQYYQRQRVDVKVVILAHDYSYRRSVFPQIRERIAKSIRDFLGNSLSGSVWILLSPSEYNEWGLETDREQVDRVFQGT